MGAWGTGLYQDDVTFDIKEEYINFLKVGMSNEEAIKELIDGYEYCIEDLEEGPLFWFALADTQWKCGRLTEKVKREALKYIEKGVDLERWKEDKKLYSKRKEVLEKLEKRLKSEQPEEKKISKLTLIKSNWEIGDVLLYQILNESLKETIWYKKYLILKVVGIHKSNIGNLPKDKYYHESSIITLYNWIGNEKPSLELFKKLKPILLQSYYNPLDGKCENMTGVIVIRKRDLKKLNIQVLLNEKDNKILENPISFYHINNFEPALISAIEREKELGNIIENI